MKVIIIRIVMIATCRACLYSDDRTILTNEHKELFNLHTNHLISSDADQNTYVKIKFNNDVRAI